MRQADDRLRRQAGSYNMPAPHIPRRSWLASEAARETCTRLTIVYAVGVPSLNCRAAKRAYKGLLAINCW